MKKNPFSGKFIVFEGIDGAGKSTQAGILYHFLKRKKIKVHLTHEPTSFLIGGIIRSSLSHDWQSPPECLQLLFAADRSYHLEKEILPLLKKGINVICDRYFFSSIAFGGYEIDDMDWLFQINQRFFLPDIVFLLEVSPKTAISRLKKERYSLTLFEKEEKFKKIAQKFKFLSKKFKNIKIIDGEKKIEEVFGKIKKEIKKLFKI